MDKQMPEVVWENNFYRAIRAKNRELLFERKSKDAMEMLIWIPLEEKSLRLLVAAILRDLAKYKQVADAARGIFGAKPEWGEALAELGAALKALDSERKEEGHDD